MKRCILPVLKTVRSAIRESIDSLGGGADEPIMALAVLTVAVLFNHDFSLAIENTQFWKIAIAGTGLHNPVQQRIGDAPLLMTNLKRDRLAIKAQDLPTALLPITINEPNDISDGNRLPAQSLIGLLTDFDIGAVQVDRGVGDQPALLGFHIEDDGLLAARL